LGTGVGVDVEITDRKLSLFKHVGIITASFHTYPEIITEVYTTASALKQRGIQVILYWVPIHINLEGNDQADKLANEARSLDVIEYAEHTPGTFNYLVDRFISNRLESLYKNYTSASNFKELVPEDHSS